MKSYSLEFVLLFIHVYTQILTTAGQCNWPTAFRNSYWIDSSKGLLHFTATSMSGWDVSAWSSSSSNWDCYLNDGTYVIAQATDTITVFGASYTGFLCMKLTQVTSRSYYYYLHAVEQPRAGYERITMFENPFTISDAVAEICTETPDTKEYHVLLQQGNDVEAKLTCPEEFWGTFWYSYNDGTTTTCNTGAESWDVCADTQVMTFDYTGCNTPIAYSNAGVVYCVVNMTSGGDIVLTLLNTDSSTDESITYKFTCLVATQTGTHIALSMAPQECTKTQTSTARPQRADGTTVGAIMNLSANVTCPTTTTTATTTSTTITKTTTTTTSATVATSTASPDNILVIVGMVLNGIIGLIIIGLVTAFILYKCCKRNQVQPAPETPQKQKSLDMDIETMDHEFFGKPIIPSILGPQETSIIIGTVTAKEQKDVLVIPTAPDIRLSVNRTSKNPYKELKRSASSPSMASLPEVNKIAKNNKSKTKHTYYSFPKVNPVAEDLIYSLPRFKQTDQRFIHEIRTQLENLEQKQSARISPISTCSRNVLCATQQRNSSVLVLPPDSLIFSRNSSTNAR